MTKYDNSERLSTVSDQDWCEALDELTTYLKWRLKDGPSGAHIVRRCWRHRRWTFTPKRPRNRGMGTCFTEKLSQ